MFSSRSPEISALQNSVSSVLTRVLFQTVLLLVMSTSAMGTKNRRSKVVVISTIKIAFVV